MIKEEIIFILMFVTLICQSQQYETLKIIRSEFQEISKEEDIEIILAIDYKNVNAQERQMIEAYRAAATCMMANYVFSSISKLKYFNKGKKQLEQLILEDKEVENVYLRLLLQLNIPRMLGYHEDIEEDIAYLQSYMAKAPIDLSYKQTMIKNLLGVTDKNELKDALLLIQLVDEG